MCAYPAAFSRAYTDHPPATTLASRPSVSSPLARQSVFDGSQPAATRPQPKRNLSLAPLSLPKSRPLRPFASIAGSLSPLSPSSQRKPVKIIEPPKNFKSEFFLNLTPTELARQD
ncbi:hypothetical protein PHLGIDRAFT_10704 [Phlebiopsis gigantea 11061_1 CR5-6]|uniref:Uncharacterized protein n=1 Tax=Phlebiopsis gigantea (strain 11061_1 CR5-6) TaxID=745531 RepID=A0A0C3P125_PHLG1|nr:hypothetical protein PHLGIDRAFT_10704 [Phlebiopsis gigantea 11061_1 CR5-6]